MADSVPMEQGTTIMASIPEDPLAMGAPMAWTQYIGEWSVKGDISILFKTVIGVLKNDGAV